LYQTSLIRSQAIARATLPTVEWLTPVFSHHLFLCRFRVRPQRLDYFRAPILGKDRIRTIGPAPKTAEAAWRLRN
jgi:hypothetical protein